MKSTYLSVFMMFLVSVCIGQSGIDDFVGLYEEGDYQEVLNKMDGMIFDPGSYELFKLKGDCHHKVEDFQKAIDNYILAEKFEDHNVELFVDRASAYMGISDYDSASKDIAKALKIDPNDATARYQKGLWNFDFYKLKPAIKEFDLAIENNNKYYEAYFMRAASLAELKKWNAALDDYKMVTDLNPDIEEAAYYSGMIFFDLEKYERALMEFEKVEKEYKYNGEYFFFRAETKYYLKDRKGSCTDYKMAADLGDQDSMNVYQNYCLDNKDKGRFKRNRETKVNL